MNNLPTIPIKQISINQKYVPLVVHYTSPESKETIIQIKLEDDQKVQEFIKNNLDKFDGIRDKNPSLYGLRLRNTNQYINEKNRSELLSVNEQVRFHEVDLCFNLLTEVKIFIEKITSLKLNNPEALINQFVSIEKYISSDQIFACEFFARGGKKIIIDYIKECDRISDFKKWTLLYHFYKILILLIQKWSLISWDMSEIDLPVIQLICDSVNESYKKTIIPDKLVLLFLEIIDDTLNNSTHTRELMLRDLKFNDVIFIIQRQNIQIKETLLVLVNNSFKKGDSTFKKNLYSILTQHQIATLLREEVKLLLNDMPDSNKNENTSNQIDEFLNNSEETINTSTAANNNNNRNNESKKNSFLFIPNPLLSSSSMAMNENNKSNQNERWSKLSTSIGDTVRYSIVSKSKQKMSDSRIASIFKPKKNSIELSEIDETIFYDEQILEENACKDEKNTETIFKNFIILQKNILDIGFSKKLRTPADNTHSSKLNFVCKSAFEASSTDKTLSEEEKYTRLGFTNCKNPLDDFQKIPPGILALEFIEYFAEKQTMRQTLYNFVSEKVPKNSDYTFPFVKASIGMIRLLCNMLHIGENEEPEEHYQILFLMFTLNNDGINEFFSKCLCLFAKIWSEMKAQSLDFDRALSALRDSLYKICTDANKINKLDDMKSPSSIYKKKITELNALWELWKYDNLKTLFRNDKSNLEPIKQVKKILTNDVIKMIKPKRMHILCKGEKFDKIQVKDKKPTKQKQVWKLSSDLKAFYITDYDNNGKEVTAGQIEIDQIKEIKKEEIRRQFYSLNLTCKRLDEQGELLFLLGSQNEEIIDFWFDGINMLINSKPTANITCFVECLIDTQLLDLQTLSFDIPNEIPKIPQLPADFEFKLLKT